MELESGDEDEFGESEQPTASDSEVLSSYDTEDPSSMSESDDSDQGHKW
jgi:hypothetical protein